MNESDTIHPNAMEYDGYEEHYATVNGVRLYYECENTGDNYGETAILLVHGWTANRFRLHPLYIAMRDKDQPVFRVELRGHAWSQRDNITDFTIPAMVEDIVQFIQQVIIGEYGFKDVILLGHSMGGSVSQGVAIRKENNLKALILLSTSAFWCDNFVRRLGTNLSIKAWKKDYTKAMAGKEAAHRKLGLMEHFPMWDTKYNIDGRDLLTTPKATWQSQESMKTFDVRSEIAKFKKPTLIATGEKDILATPRFSKWLHAHIEGSELHIIEKCGHNLDQLCPVRLREIVLPFVEKQLGR